MQTVTLAVVRGVARWRAALAAMKQNADVPFVWNNANCLLALVSGLDFLGTTCPELGEWCIYLARWGCVGELGA